MREVAAWLPFDRVAGRRQEADGMGSDAMQASQVLREWCEEAMQGGAMRGGQLREDPFEGGRRRWARQRHRDVTAGVPDRKVRPRR